MPSETELDNLRRDCLAAIAMAYAPATDVPRERALMQSAVASLIAKFGDCSFTEASAIDEISRHGTLPELRPDLAKTLVAQLVDSQLLLPAGGNASATFTFSHAFVERTRESQAAINALIDKVIDDLFDDLSLTGEAKLELRRRLLLCLARIMSTFGRAFVGHTAGSIAAPPIIERHNLISLCKGVLSSDKVTHVSQERMADAIAELFARKEPHFARFVLSLAQNYFYLRLLGLDGGLKLLSEDRFAGAQFFLDTNILIRFLFPSSPHYRSVLELRECARRLSISLQASEVSLSEVRAVFGYTRGVLAKVFDEVPDDLVEATGSDFLISYRNEKKSRRDLTVKAFFGGLEDYRSRLQTEWGIKFVDEPIEKKIDKQQYNQVRAIIQRCSGGRHRAKKRESALDHDTHMYFLVLAERKEHGDKAAWLLTLDSSLPHAARKLQPKDAIPFCMHIERFLQILSPYVRNDHQQSFAEMFVEVIGRNLFPPEEVIELEDFRMFTDFDLSVRKLPAADVIKVIRRVKQALGGNLQQPDMRAVAYEVQKALSDPGLSYHTELEGKVERLAQEVQEKKEEIAERDQKILDQTSKHQTQVDTLRQDFNGQIEKVRLELLAYKETIENEKAEKKKLETKNARLRLLVRIIVTAAIVLPAAIGIWLAPRESLSAFQYPRLFQLAVSVAALCAGIAFLLRNTIVTMLMLGFAALAAVLAVGRVLK